MLLHEPVTDLARPIVATFDRAVERLRIRLAGMTDDEYLWEPVAGCWSLWPNSDGHWRLDGGGGGGPSPDPVPVTTIAWRIGHIAGTVAGFTDRRFSNGLLVAEELGFPSSADATASFLAEHCRDWRDALVALDRESWVAPLGPRFGPFAEARTVDLALHVLDEVIHHAAEVGVLRDLWSADARCW